MIRKIIQITEHFAIQARRVLNQRRFTLGVLSAALILNLSTSGPIAPAQEVSQAAVAQAAVAQIVVSQVAVDQLVEFEPANFLGVPFWDDDIYKMMVRFAFNLVFLLMVVGISYNGNNEKNQRYLFLFFIMNVVVFFICFTLKKLELELGMALGLFAIFAIIRYRTEQIDAKDMTYLFVVIGLAVINSLSNKKTSYVELVFTNTAVFAACLIMERVMGPEVKKVKLTRSEVVYEKLDLLRPENVSELYEDIYQRTGIRADRVEIKQIDFQNGTSLIDVRQSKERAYELQAEVASSKLG